MRTVSGLLRLDERVAVVTGGAGHLGLAFAEALAECGAHVVLVDRPSSECEGRASGLAARFGVRVVTVRTDLADPAAADAIVAATMRAFGRLDILVNNAAFTGATNLAGWVAPLAEQSLEAWDAALRVNLSAAFLLTRQAATALAASGHGAVVNVASMYGVVAPDFRLYDGTSMGNPAAYGASKAALIHLTRYLATSMAPTVRVNALSPGGIARGQPELFVDRYRARTPLGRMGTEEDMKGALAFLASDASAYMTGQNVVVDGGWTAW
jgi:NAD(P)-dependent dehydrogenase (short-subunit alcohol dehydrogenase family)